MPIEKPADGPSRLTVRDAWNDLARNCDGVSELLDTWTDGEQRESDKVGLGLAATKARIGAELYEFDDLHWLDIGELDELTVSVAYLETLVDRATVERHIIEPLRKWYQANAPDPKYPPVYMSTIITAQLGVSQLRTVYTIPDAVGALLMGDTIVAMDGSVDIIACSTQSRPIRAVEESAVETSIVGSHDAFVEDLQRNLSLVRSRLRDSRLRAPITLVGTRSRTRVALLYIDDIARPELVGEVLDRVRNLHVDAVSTTFAVKELIEGKRLPFFPIARRTERPDTVMAALLEGRVALMADSSPNAFILPAVGPDFLMAADDYYLPSLISLVLRSIRVLGLLIVAFLPALYIAAASYNPDIIPPNFSQSLAQSRAGVPMNVVTEVIFMEAMMELLQEASVRLPQKIGAVATVFGGLILGQAAAAARIISSVIVIVVAMTAIGSFVLPSYEISLAARATKWLVVIGAAFFGMYGIAVLTFLVLGYLNSLNSFGTPYLAPFSPPVWSDIVQDTAVRLPRWGARQRYQSMVPQDRDRQ